MPHPSEPLVNLRLQTSGRPAVDVLREGLAALATFADTLGERFNEALGTAGIDPEIEKMAPLAASAAAAAGGAGAAAEEAGAAGAAAGK
jgi:hypothetical protein